MTTAMQEACGTEASPARYRRHLRRGEATCPDCRRAHADSVNAWRLSYRQGVRRRRKARQQAQQTQEAA